MSEHVGNEAGEALRGISPWAIIEAAPDAMLISDGTGRVLAGNRRAEALFGTEPGALDGRPLDELVPGRERAVHRDGSTVPVEVSSSPLDTRSGPLVLSAVHDVSERRRAQELAARARHQEVVVALGQLALSGAAVDDLLRTAHDRVAAELGLPGDEVLEQIEDGTVIVEVRDGHELPEVDVQFLEAVATLLSTVIARRRAEEALRESQEHLQGVLDNSPAIIVLKDPEGRFQLVNRRFIEDFGFGGRDVTGITDHDLFDARTAARMVEGDARVLETGEVLEVQETIEVGGVPRTYMAMKFPLRDEDGRPVAVGAIATDITGREQARRERELLEGQVQKAQRMESIGQLAGGVAHDFNNLLAVIANAADFLAEGMPAGTPQLDDVEQIRRAASMAASLTRQLLIFSRREHGRPEVININDVVRETDKLLRRTLGEHITLRTGLDPALPPVEIDATQLEQLLINLAVNARDAMPDGGTLTIATHVAGPAVALVVRDTGTGMTPEVAERAFEPFYTTKPSGKGTGLGLATAYGVVGRAAGSIELDSVLGEGTAVTVRLPIAGGRSARRAVDPDRGAPRGAGQLLLVAEDNEGVREIARRLLEDGGYRVALAADAREAQAVWAERREEVALLLTDVVMPGPSGSELAAALRAERPGLPVIFMTGYADEAVLRDETTPPSAIVGKPFDRTDLLRAVHAALGSPVT